MAAEGEEAVKDGRTRWDCIHKLQRVHGGRRPVRPTAVLKDDGQFLRRYLIVGTNILRKYLMSRVSMMMKWLLLCLLLSQCYILMIPLRRWRS